MVRGADGAGREVVCSTFAVELSGSPHWVAILRDLSGPRAGARTALALAQTAVRPVTGTIEEALASIARHAVEGTRALMVADRRAGPPASPPSAATGSPEPAATSGLVAAWRAASVTLEDLPGGEVLLTGRPVVLPDARTRWEADPRLADFAAMLAGVGWQSVAYVPLSWEGRVFGILCAMLPSGLDGPSTLELAVYTALAGQAAVAVVNARLAASLERARLARELHNSVSQALFSMTMHARAAQLAMTQAGLDHSGPLGRAVAQLADLAEGPWLRCGPYFELRPAALAEEGLVAALRAQAAALTAREGLPVTVDGPEGRLGLGAGTEEHLYRIVLEALHNVVKHARASRADIRITTQDGIMRVTVSDDGVGFDPGAGHSGHLGLSTMTARARAIGAELTVTSAPGAGTTVTLVLSDHPGRRPDVPDDLRPLGRAPSLGPTPGCLTRTSARPGDSVDCGPVTGVPSWVS